MLGRSLIRYALLNVLLWRGIVALCAIIAPCVLSPVFAAHLEDLEDDLSLMDEDRAAEGASGGRPLEESVAEFEKGLLVEALRSHGGNQTQTAKALGLSRPGLFKKLRRYGIQAEKS